MKVIPVNYSCWPPRTLSGAKEGLVEDGRGEPLNLPSTFKEISDSGKTRTHKIILPTKTLLSP